MHEQVLNRLIYALSACFEIHVNRLILNIVALLTTVISSQPQPVHRGGLKPKTFERLWKGKRWPDEDPTQQQLRKTVVHRSDGYRELHMSSKVLHDGQYS
ncbi:hypothetical protein EVAR_37401_1 [Eumeta japonica]|uniref:Uncharacterized protein n=1 Tax=Eumeta variegata TaxID=151549 RepID=A0A4C1WGZ1_EUMVA|nr:hypothetical protein EVAR_37401_1 [Eumeta japonica]